MTNKGKTMKKLAALLLVFTLLLGSFPVVYSEEGEAAENEAQQHAVPCERADRRSRRKERPDQGKSAKGSDPRILTVQYRGKRGKKCQLKTQTYSRKTV